MRYKMLTLLLLLILLFIGVFEPKAKGLVSVILILLLCKLGS